MKKRFFDFYQDTRGMALLSAMTILTLLFFMGNASLLKTITEHKISVNHKRGIHAFYDCEAGIAEAIAQIKNDTAVFDQNGDPNWQTTQNLSLFKYRYHTLFDPNTHLYTIISEGKDPLQKANRRIVAEVRRLFHASDIKSPVYCGSGKNKGHPNSITGDSVCPTWADDGDPNNNYSVPCVSSPNPYESSKKPLDIDLANLQTSASATLEYNGDEIDLVTMANYYKDLPPDRTSIPVATTETIGSPTDTKVVYINGNQTIAGKLTGYGILVVTGDLHISGQINWNGVIIVLGNNVIQTGGGASSEIQVTGAVLTPNHFEIRGNSDIQWCGDVVRKVINDAGDPLHVVSWREE